MLGAIGFTIDVIDKKVKVLELIENVLGSLDNEITVKTTAHKAASQSPDNFDTMPIGPIEIPAEKSPSTSPRERPQSSREPRAHSPMICHSVLSGAQREGCS